MREDIRTKLTQKMQEVFQKEPEGFVTAPGRVELLGNHTDHQHGKALAASVDLRTYAAYALNGTNQVNVWSEGHSLIEIDLNDLMPAVSEFNNGKSIVRGVLFGFYLRHKEGRLPGDGLKGVDICIHSEVLTGSGLSSSAAFEVLLGRILNQLFFENAASAIEIAKIGRYAENRYFGKPCGLMDQAACSVGNVVFFDFQDPEEPAVQQIDFDFGKAGYALCAVECGGGHSDLTGDYAAIPKDMCAVAELFGKKVLHDVPEEEVRSGREMILEKLGEGPYLRALHFYDETRRAEEAAKALQNGDMQQFLKLANESGISSRTQLKNVIPASDPSETRLDQAMRKAVALLGGKQLDGSEGGGMQGAVRMNGGGFSGTFLCIVPQELLESFRTSIEEQLGSGCCHVLNT